MQTDWDELYRRRETPWEKGRPHPGLVDFLAEHEPLAGEILVPGCGSGHDVRALSTSDNRVLGVDLASSAVARAQAEPKRGQESYLLADFLSLPNEHNNRFDWIFEHTCFCAIDPKRRREYVEAIVRLLKPAGRMLAIFFINPDHDEEGPPYRVNRAELEDFFGNDFETEQEWVPQRTHPGREQRELMRVMRKRAVPGNASS